MGDEEDADDHRREQRCGEDTQEARGEVQSLARYAKERSQGSRRYSELFFFFLLETEGDVDKNI